MMVEVPAAALTIEDFNADFFSIGSNDLIQYVAATSRTNRNSLTWLVFTRGPCSAAADSLKAVVIQRHS